MKRLLYVVALCGAALVFQGASCRPKPPNPIPTPTPPPAPVVMFPELLLRQVEGGKLVRAGVPFKPFGAIPCCMEWDKPTGWPMFSKEWVDYTSAKGANFYHLRLGPWFADVEPEWTATGGAYLPNSTEFNPAFWERVRGLVEYAGSKGANVEVDLIDGWGCKVSQRGDRYNSFPAPDVHACGKQWTAEHLRFVTKAVEERGRYANVIWQDSNEAGQIEGYNPAWSLAMRDAVREAEQHLPAMGVVHLFGTNSERDEVELSAGIDLTTTHKRQGIDGPYAGKHRQNNEHNPEFTPEQEHALYCAAQAAGQHWWFWRAGMSAEAMEQTLSLFGSGCAGFVEGECPFEVPEVAFIQAKPHASQPGQVLFDATPLTTGGAYCRSIGFTDGRTVCPIQMEGSPFRGQCEIKAMGGEIQWSLPSGSPLTLNPRQYGFQAVVTGASGASGAILCSFPKANGAQMCRAPASAGGGPVIAVIP